MRIPFHTLVSPRERKHIYTTTTTIPRNKQRILSKEIVARTEINVNAF